MVVIVIAPRPGPSTLLPQYYWLYSLYLISLWLFYNYRFELLNPFTFSTQPPNPCRVLSRSGLLDGKLLDGDKQGQEELALLRTSPGFLFSLSCPLAVKFLKRRMGWGFVMKKEWKRSSGKTEAWPWPEIRRKQWSLQMSEQENRVESLI